MYPFHVANPTATNAVTRWVGGDISETELGRGVIYAERINGALAWLLDYQPLPILPL